MKKNNKFIQVSSQFIDVIVTCKCNENFWVCKTIELQKGINTIDPVCEKCHEKQLSEMIIVERT